MSQKQTDKKKASKAIRVSIKDSDVTKVRVSFTGDGMFTVEEFTALFMGVLEEYTKGMIKANQPDGEGKVYDHWNRVFGIFLSKILPEKRIYDRDQAHKELKELAEDTLSQPEDAKENAANRLAAYTLARDILTEEVGMTGESADLILNRRLGLLPPKPKADA